jgi:hypothetical protein
MVAVFVVVFLVAFLGGLVLVMHDPHKALAPVPAAEQPTTAAPAQPEAAPVTPPAKPRRGDSAVIRGHRP